MSTPALSSFSSSAPEPTRKALRQTYATTGHNADLGEIVATIATLGRRSCQNLSRMPLDLLERASSKLSTAVKAAKQRQKEEREVEVLLPMDLLLHTFSFLSARELHASRVCWYFERGVKSAMFSAILAYDSTIKPYSMNVGVLIMFETDVPRVLELVKSLDESMIDVNKYIEHPDAHSVFVQLKSKAGRVLTACKDAFVDKIEILTKSPNADKTILLRNGLWEIVVLRMVIKKEMKLPDRLVEMALVDMKLIDPPTWVVAALKYLPVEILEAHVHLIVPHADDDMFAVDALENVSPSLLLQHNAEPMLTRFYEQCMKENNEIGHTGAETAKRMLDAIHKARLVCG